MKALDTNILIYSHREDSGFFDRAFECVRKLAEGSEPWAIPCPCIHEFLSIVTHPRIYNPPTPLDLALEQVDAWLESPTLELLSEQAGYWETFRSLLCSSRICGPQIHDARIAALCLYHGVSELWTADRDFGRFTDLNFSNPLIQ